MNFIFVISLNLLFLLINQLNQLTLNQLFYSLVIFNILNLLILIYPVFRTRGHISLPSFFNLTFNISAILFLYPDALLFNSDLENYGNIFYISKSANICILYQSIVTIFLKILEFRGLGLIKFEIFSRLFKKKSFFFFIINISLIGLLFYFFRGYSLTSLISSRADGFIGSFFKISTSAGSLDTIFLCLNYFIRFLSLLGLIQITSLIFSFILKKSYKRDFFLFGNFKYLIILFTFFYLISSITSDVRQNLVLLFIPAFIVIFVIPFTTSTNNLKFINLRTNIEKILKLSLVLLLLIAIIFISENQVFNRGQIGYSYLGSRGIINSDSSLYSLSETVKLVDKNGDLNFREKFYYSYEAFVPSFLINKKTKIDLSNYGDVRGNIVERFNKEIFNISVSLTILGEFIYGFGVIQGFIFCIFSTILIFYLSVKVLEFYSKKDFFGFLLFSYLGNLVFLSRSIFHFLNLNSLLLYALVVYIIFKNIYLNIVQNKS